MEKSGSDIERPAKRAKLSGGGHPSDDGPATSTTKKGAAVAATLPSTLWARSFDFLPYSDVRSGRLVCKLLAKEAPRHVETLNIFEGAEMDVPNARLYPNVRNLNVLCMMIDDSHNVEAFQNIVSFLQAFHRLEKVFLGNKTPYGKIVCLKPTGMPVQDYKTVISNLLESLCNAFQTRALPRDIDLKCILHNSLNDHFGLGSLCPEQGPVDGDEGGGGDGGGEDDCLLCKRIFSYFPFRFCGDLRCRCMSYTERFELMAKRPGMKERLMSPEFLTDALDANFSWSSASISASPEPDLKPFYFEIEGFRKIKAIVDFGNDPRKVDMSAVLERAHRAFELTRPALGVIYVDIFTKLGFHIPTTDDVFILDEEASPHLRNDIGDIYGDEYEDLIALKGELFG